MPELPEVETVVRGLREEIIGLVVREVRLYTERIWQGKTGSTPEKLCGKKIEGSERRGKWIILRFSGGTRLLVHLGMTGRLVCVPSSAALDSYDRFLMVFEGHDLQLLLRDPRKFSRLALFLPGEEVKVLDGLGPEPLDLSFSEFGTLFRKRKARLKAVLLDQHFLAGIGNIYSDEILFHAGLHPLMRASDLDGIRTKRLWRAVKQILKQAIRWRGSSVRDFQDARDNPGSYQHFHRVYGRGGKPCFQCGRPIERIRVQGRGTYFCPRCQSRITSG